MVVSNTSRITLSPEFIIYGNELHRCIFPTDDIIDINVIVPNKVTEFTFWGHKEPVKLVRHSGDIFDLRKACFIAIAKLKYGNEYTLEGVEEMAHQLSLQKKYVKIVDKAMKAYEKKVADEEKAKKEAKELEEMIARKRAKRLKRLAARKEKAEQAANAAREEEIEIQSEALYRAMKKINSEAAGD